MKLLRGQCGRHHTLICTVWRLHLERIVLLLYYSLFIKNNAIVEYI